MRWLARIDKRLRPIKLAADSVCLGDAIGIVEVIGSLSPRDNVRVQAPTRFRLIPQCDG